MLQGQKDLLTVGRLILSELAPVVVGAARRVLHPRRGRADEPALKLLASYAYQERKNIDNRFKLGEGLVGQCASRRRRSSSPTCPPTTSRSPRASARPSRSTSSSCRSCSRARSRRVIELASLRPVQPDAPDLPRPAHRIIGIVLQHDRSEHAYRGPAQAVAVARPRAADAAAGSCSRPTPSSRRRPSCSPSRTSKWSGRTREVEQARQALEEKAKQLALTSKYKSEFLANMSHELRTPLNSAADPVGPAVPRTPRAT